MNKITVDKWIAMVTGFKLSIIAGNTNCRGRLSTVDLLIMLACFCKKVNNVFDIKCSGSKRVNTRRSTLLNLHPLLSIHLVPVL